MSVTISWSIPQNILKDEHYTAICIFKGTDEGDLNSYKQIDTIDRWESTVSETGEKEWEYEQEILTYTDLAQSDTENIFYYVKYKTDSGKMSKMLLTFFEMSPRQVRFCDELRNLLDPIITSIIQIDGTFKSMSDEDLMAGIKLAISYFNSYIPGSTFKLETFPQKYEGIMMLYAMLFTIVYKSIGLEMRDFSYSDNGLSLNQQFTPALQNAISNLNNLLNGFLDKLAMEFSVGDLTYYSVGSYPFAMSGGRLTAGGGIGSDILNVYNSISMQR